MTNTLTLAIASASVPGRDHQRAGRRSQDALCVVRGSTHVAAVVADGCGSAPHSEVGAILGARWMAAELVAQFERAGPGLGEGAAGSAACSEPAEFEAARLLVLARLLRLGSELGGSLLEAVREHLLFTLVGVVVGPAHTWTFSLGDGCIAVDDAVRTLGPFEGNRPPYLAYALLPQAAHGLTDSALRLRVDGPIPNEQWSGLLVATDGALELVQSGGHERLLQDGRLQHNPDLLRRTLWLLARDRPGHAGSLADDTTVVILRQVRS